MFKVKGSHSTHGASTQVAFGPWALPSCLVIRGLGACQPRSMAVLLGYSRSQRSVSSDFLGVFYPLKPPYVPACTGGIFERLA